jgi:hypothetical protein
MVLSISLWSSAFGLWSSAIGVCGAAGLKVIGQHVSITRLAYVTQDQQRHDFLRRLDELVLTGEAPKITRTGPVCKLQADAKPLPGYCLAAMPKPYGRQMVDQRSSASCSFARAESMLKCAQT